MLRKILAVSFGILLLAGSISWAASSNSQQIRRDNTEMRKSVVWLMEGLTALSKTKDGKLQLKPNQKKKILPIFQALVREKVLVLTVDRRNQVYGQNSNRPNNQNGADNSQGQRWGMDPNDPRVQARMKQMQEQTAFGNKQADLIDGILNEKQVAFIDNLNFDAEKYGFLDFRNSMGGSQNNGQSGGQSQGQFQRPDPQVMAKIRQQMQAGRENLVKLCNTVLKVLKG